MPALSIANMLNPILGLPHPSSLNSAPDMTPATTSSLSPPPGPPLEVGQLQLQNTVTLPGTFALYESLIFSDSSASESDSQSSARVRVLPSAKSLIRASKATSPTEIAAQDRTARWVFQQRLLDTTPSAQDERHVQLYASNAYSDPDGSGSTVSFTSDDLGFIHGHPINAVAPGAAQHMRMPSHRSSSDSRPRAATPPALENPTAATYTHFFFCTPPPTVRLIAPLPRRAFVPAPDFLFEDPATLSIPTLALPSFSGTIGTDPTSTHGLFTFPASPVFTGAPASQTLSALTAGLLEPAGTTSRFECLQQDVEFEEDETDALLRITALNAEAGMWDDAPDSLFLPADVDMRDAAQDVVHTLDVAPADTVGQLADILNRGGGASAASSTRVGDIEPSKPLFGAAAYEDLVFRQVLATRNVAAAQAEPARGQVGGDENVPP